MPRGFLNSDLPDPESEVPKFTALGQAGSEAYAGLEFFPNPGLATVQYTSDEVVAHCPITGQPDFYTLTIQMNNAPYCIESKSLKLWLRQFSREDGPGIFCEALAVYIREHVIEAMNAQGEWDDESEMMDRDKIVVQLTQKSRGGISIRSVA